MKNTTAPSVVSTSPAAVVSGYTPGLDLGDRQHHVCVLNAAGQIAGANADDVFGSAFAVDSFGGAVQFLSSGHFTPQRSCHANQTRKHPS